MQLPVSSAVLSNSVIQKTGFRNTSLLNTRRGLFTGFASHFCFYANIGLFLNY